MNDQVECQVIASKSSRNSVSLPRVFAKHKQHVKSRTRSRNQPCVSIRNSCGSCALCNAASAWCCLQGPSKCAITVMYGAPRQPHSQQVSKCQLPDCWISRPQGWLRHAYTFRVTDLMSGKTKDCMHGSWTSKVAHRPAYTCNTFPLSLQLAEHLSGSGLNSKAYLNPA